jgi:hypothetical protein
VCVGVGVYAHAICNESRSHMLFFAVTCLPLRPPLPRFTLSFSRLLSLARALAFALTLQQTISSSPLPSPSLSLPSVKFQNWPFELAKSTWHFHMLDHLHLLDFFDWNFHDLVDVNEFLNCG